MDSDTRGKPRLPAQPVDATPSAMNVFSKGGVYDATNPGAAFVCAEGDLWRLQESETFHVEQIRNP
jgi:hypothetical protein